MAVYARTALGARLEEHLRLTLDRSRLARTLVKSPAVQHILITVRGMRLVQERLRFVRGQMRGGGILARYTLREGGLIVHVRHRTPDVATLVEVFGTRLYELPRSTAESFECSPGPVRVVDLGANIGMFGAWIHGRLPGVEITAVEPDPTNAALLRRTIEANGLADRWRLIEACAATSQGSIPFKVGAFNISRVAEADEAGDATVDALDAFSLLAEADLVKIDIEGGEWAILSDPRFRALSAPALVMEWHERGAPAQDAERCAETALRLAGYQTERGLQLLPEAGTIWGFKP